MREELTKKLYKKFPSLFKNRNHPMSLMKFGFSCGDGWYDLIYKLCEDITELAREEGMDIDVVQVKEKYGFLRFYIGPATMKIFELIFEAETKSSKICEVCGEEGKNIEIDGWWQTLCETCEEKKISTVVENKMKLLERIKQEKKREKDA